MKYSLFNNIKYVFYYAFLNNKKMKIMVPTFIFTSIIIPIIATVTPAIVVGFITEGQSIRNFLLVIGLLFILYGSLLFIKQYLTKKLWAEYITTRTTQFYIGISEKLMKTDYINVEPQEKQNIIQKAMNALNSNWVGLEFMLKNTPIFIINITGLLLYSAFITSLHWLIIVVLIVMSVLNYVLNKYAQNYEQKHKTEYAKLDRQIQYVYNNSITLENAKDVKIYKLEKWFYHIFHVLIKKRVNWTKKIEYRYFLPSLSDNLLLFIRDIIAYGILINLVINQEISIATFILFIGVIGQFSTWLTESVTAFSNLKRANLGVNDYRNFMDIDEVFNHKEGSPIPNNVPLEIEFKNVSFHYPGEDKNTLSNLNFTISKGSKIALVGNNGAGKTTLVKLLTGLYYPTEGEIFVNGKAIGDYNLDEYQSLVGAVFQEVEILAFSLVKNVSAKKEADINYDKYWHSVELAGLREKIESLKNKEQTHLTQSLDKEGILLSGGEMQKLMLARALYKDAPIMILDEPTAALDPLAEAELYEKYNDLTIDKTSLFISHRLSSTKFCDRILFLDHGEVVEDGTHDELMKLNGKYAHMFTIQSHYYKEDLEVSGNE